MKKLLLVLLFALARLPALAQLPPSNDVVVLDSWRIHDGDDLNVGAAGLRRLEVDANHESGTIEPLGHTAWISLVQNDGRAAKAA